MQPATEDSGVISIASGDSHGQGGPSIGSFYSAARARAQNNQDHIKEITELNDLQKTLAEAASSFGKESCLSCWLDDKPSHSGDQCPSEGVSLSSSSEAFKNFKSNYKLPTWHCWRCALPQV